MVLGPAVRVGLVEVQVGAVEEAGPAPVALPAHRVRGAGDGRGVHVPHPVPQRPDGRGGLLARRRQFGAEPGGERVGPGGGEHLEPAGPFAPARPLGELPDEGGGGAGASEQLALQAEGERGAVALQGGRHRAQPGRHRRPVLLGLCRHHGEDDADAVRGRAQVADGAEALLGLVHGQFRRQALPQQPGAPPLGVAVGPRHPLGRVEPGERAAGEVGHGPLAGGREVGQQSGALPDSQVRTGDRVEGDECVDVVVGDLAGQRAAGDLWHGGHPGLFRGPASSSSGFSRLTRRGSRRAAGAGRTPTAGRSTGSPPGPPRGRR